MRAGVAIGSVGESATLSPFAGDAMAGFALATLGLRPLRCGSGDGADGGVVFGFAARGLRGAAGFFADAAGFGGTGRSPDASPVVVLRLAIGAA